MRMKVLCVFGKHQYGRAALGEGIEHAAFIPALRRLGHEVVHFDSWDRSAYADFVGLNRALLECVRKEKPDVMLAVQRDCEIWTETLASIRELAPTPTVPRPPDTPVTHPEHTPFIDHPHTPTPT